MTLPNGVIFTGQFDYDRPNGLGVLNAVNGERLEGEFRNGALHGVGVIWNAGGSVRLAGRFENEQLVGSQ